MDIALLVFNIINLLLLLYFIGAKSYAEKKGSNLADKEDIGHLTKEIESVKAIFSQQNIAYQIYNSEYVKLRFQRLDNLYHKLYELKKVCDEEFWAPHQDEFPRKVHRYTIASKVAEDAFYHSLIYVESEGLQATVVEFFNKCRVAFDAYMQNRTVGDRLDKARESGDNDLTNRYAEMSTKSFSKMIDAIDDLPEILQNVEREFKRHLTITK